jgi:hypothetical protein
MAAYRLGICRAQLYKEVQAGRLSVRKLGRRTLVPRVEQERWLTALPIHVPTGSEQVDDPALSRMTEDELVAVIERAKPAAVAA